MALPYGFGPFDFKSRHYGPEARRLIRNIVLGLFAAAGVLTYIAWLVWPKH